jgi:hypothetical protein
MCRYHCAQYFLEDWFILCPVSLLGLWTEVSDSPFFWLGCAISWVKVELGPSLLGASIPSILGAILFSIHFGHAQDYCNIPLVSHSHLRSTTCMQMDDLNLRCHPLQRKARVLHMKQILVSFNMHPCRLKTVPRFGPPYFLSIFKEFRAHGATGSGQISE